AANRRAALRIAELAEKYGADQLLEQMDRLLDYTEALTKSCIASIPDGSYEAVDYLDDDGHGTEKIPIRVRLDIAGEQASLDFQGSAEQVPGPVNCVYAVTLSAVAYCFRCLLP